MRLSGEVAEAVAAEVVEGLDGFDLLLDSSVCRRLARPAMVVRERVGREKPELTYCTRRGG